MSYFLASAAMGQWLDVSFAEFDMAVFRFFGSIQNEILTFLAKVFTTMGSVPYVALFAVLGLILFFFKRTRKYGMALIFAIIIGTLLTNIIIKPLFLRIRPYNTLQAVSEYFGWYQGAGMFSESDYSFPSGHTTGAMEIAVALCLCFSTDKKKRFAWIFPIVGLLTAGSRVYLMVHYATDVIGGIIIGLIAGIAGFLIARVLARLMDSSEKLDKLDLGRIARIKTSPHSAGRMGALSVILAWAIIFVVSFTPVAGYNRDKVITCSYEGAYKCYNEAQVSSKYPPINGKYYCKIHWKELSE